MPKKKFQLSVKINHMYFDSRYDARIQAAL